MSHGQNATVGSTNVDFWSFLRNDELNAVIVSRDFAAKMDAAFSKDLEQSKQILFGGMGKPSAQRSDPRVALSPACTLVVTAPGLRGLSAAMRYGNALRRLIFHCGGLSLVQAGRHTRQLVYEGRVSGETHAVSRPKEPPCLALLNWTATSRFTSSISVRRLCCAI